MTIHYEAFIAGSNSLKTLIATSEMVPFAKTGGLADVCGALPVELTRLGVTCSIIMPAYRAAIESGQPNKQLNIEFEVPIGCKNVPARLLHSKLPGSSVDVYLIEQDDYFDRPQLYREQGKDYKDNCERFVFFCRAVMESIRLLELNVDVIHCNDWQTGLIPAFLKIEYSGRPVYDQIATLMTIHNMAYQGQFWHWDMLLTGLDWKYFNWHQMEFWGKLNLLKTGLCFADAINTVSPRYAVEIQTEPLGCGLDGIIARRSHVVRGILNGVDYLTWNPTTDPHISANYGPDNWQVGKARCKKDLGAEFGLAVADNIPLVGMVGRLADQKGLDLVAEIIPKWLQEGKAHWIVLGSGEAKYQDLFKKLAAEHPRKLASRIEFSEPLAHRIEAGADMFLMPSRYEPCGLNQMYSLKYGTVPIVRAVGGLADTIVDANDWTMGAGTANGFSFEPYESVDLDQTLSRAIEMFRKKEAWSSLVSTGIRQDWTWSRSARSYLDFYQDTVARVRQTVFQ